MQDLESHGSEGIRGYYDIRDVKVGGKPVEVIVQEILVGGMVNARTKRLAFVSDRAMSVSAEGGLRITFQAREVGTKNRVFVAILAAFQVEALNPARENFFDLHPKGGGRFGEISPEGDFICVQQLGRMPEAAGGIVRRWQMIS